MNKLLMNKKVINIINDCKDLNFVLKENEMLIVNYYCDNQESTNIKISQTENSYFVLNMSCIVKKDCTININGNISGNDNRCVINVRCLAQNNIGTFNVCVKACEETKDNEIIEDLKGINEDGSIAFIPVLEVDTNEVDAQHFATIGSFDENELFYLQTKGISLKSAYELLKRSFMYSLFNSEFMAMINKGEDKDE
ncbi:MAG: SufD family Fe-S cluster assembly protein [Bacilli bacterium]|nr:SufD family Fe-S cluster assembly protein [Bacilli bacterium]